MSAWRECQRVLHVWTYDIYGAYINKKASDSHYVLMGRWSTVVA